MSAAEVLLYPNYSLQSPDVAASVSQAASVAIGQTVPTSRGGMMTTQAPTITPSTPTISGGGFLGTLEKYMQLIMLAMIQLVADDAQVSQTQYQTSSDLVQLSVNQTNIADQALDKLQKSIAKQKHESFWQKLGSDIAGGCLCLAGILTGQPELVLMGAMMIVMMNTGLSNKLNGLFTTIADKTHLDKALGGLASKILVEVLIIVAVSLILGGAGALFDSAANSGEEAADGAETQTSKVSLRSVAGTSLQVGAFTNVYTDVMMGMEEILKAMHVIKHTSQEFAQYAGMALTIAATILGTGLSVSADAGALGKTMSQKFVDMFENPLTGERCFIRLKTGVQITRAAASGFSAVWNVQAGLTEVARTAIIKEMGYSQATQTILSNALGMVNEQTSQNQTAEGQVNDAFADINSRWTSYVNQYATAARVIGQHA
jgi:hypothetical protein